MIGHRKKENAEKEISESIEEYTLYFSFYKDIPGMITGIFVSLFLACVIVAVANGMMKTIFGVGVFILLILMGTAVIFSVYYLLKLSCAYKILHIAYLKKIEENTRKREK